MYRGGASGRDIGTLGSRVPSISEVSNALNVTMSSYNMYYITPPPLPLYKREL